MIPSLGWERAEPLAVDRDSSFLPCGNRLESTLLPQMFSAANQYNTRLMTVA